MITVFNKADKCGEKISYPKIVGKDKIYLSAKEDVSIDLLTDMILDRIYEDYEPAEFLIPYEDGRTLSYFMENAHVTDKEYQEKGTLIKVKCHKADRDKYKDYLPAE